MTRDTMRRTAMFGAGLAVGTAMLASSAAAQTAGPSLTAAQAERGQESYQHWCLTCHGSELDNGEFGGPPLKGSWFNTHWGAGDAGAVFAYMKGLMPPDNPGGLNDTTYADILAFSLQRNGYPA